MPLWELFPRKIQIPFISAPELILAPEKCWKPRTLHCSRNRTASRPLTFSFSGQWRGERDSRPHHKLSSVICIPLFHFICPDDYWLFKCNQELLNFTVVVSLPVSELLDGAHLHRYSTLLFREAGCAWKGAAGTLAQGMLCNDSFPCCDGSKDRWCLQD